jgi:glycosyltransferase involved in cell wall biosynthesis
MNLECIHEKYTENITIVNSIGIKRGYITWQFIPSKYIYDNFDLIFFSGNPWVISNVFWATLFKLLGKKIVIWGQYHTFNSCKLTEYIRLLWWRTFRNVFLYTEMEEKQYKQSRSGSAVVISMNNGLDQSDINHARNSINQNTLDEWTEYHHVKGKQVILSCARLDREKKFDDMIRALPEVIRQHPDTVWCVIGGGVEKSRLTAMAAGLNVSQYIHWLGPIYEEEKLAPWFMSAICLVHPGAIGLSLLHAMGYGLPVVTHDNPLNHGPEFSTLNPGVNGVLYKEDDVSSLSEQIIRLIENKELAKSLSEQAIMTVNEKYNTRVMAEKFIEMVDSAI